MARRITIDERAVRALKKLPKKAARRILKAIEKLGGDSAPPGSTKLEATEHLRKIRVGDYRVVYAVEANETFVMKVADRKDVYEGLHALEKRLVWLHIKKK